MKNESKNFHNTRFDPFSGPQIEKVIHTTKAQSEIIIDCALGGNDANRAYNISFSLNFYGDLNFVALENAIKTLIKRHESLRASFSEDGRLMSIFSDIDVDFSVTDISDQAEAEKQQFKEDKILKEANYIFDLVNGPLFTVSLTKIKKLEHLFILTVHHSICDGLSINTFMEELGLLYSAYVQDKKPTLPEADHFSIFAEKENLFTESNEYKLSEKFWLNMYKDSIPQIELPVDFPRPKLRTYNNHRIDFLLDSNLLAKIKQTGLDAGSSAVTALMTAFEIFVYQQTGQKDIIVGLTNSRSTHYGMTQLIGHAVNVLPLRSRINTKICFKEYLQQRKTQLFDAYEHQVISFGHLLEKLSVSRDPARIPLVPVMLNLELNKNLESEISFFNLSHELALNIGDYGTFEIEIQAFMSKDGPCFRWKYNTTLFKPDTIKQMMSSFEELIEKLVSNPNKTISEIIVGDFRNVYNSLNNTKASYSDDVLHKLIQNMAEENPEKFALEFQNKRFNYKSLQQQSNQFAHYFIEQGVLPGDFIAVSLPRCPELVSVLLALMQCGAAYLPIDPDYPQSRIEFMLKDSEAKFLITTKLLEPNFPDEPAKLILEQLLESSVNYNSTPLNIAVEQETIAYIIYTSGSTGKPKGITVTHRNLVNFLTSMAAEPGIEKNDRLLSITTLSFDISGLELFLPLLCGATLVLADDDTARDGRLLLDLIQQNNITILQATPTTWQMLLDMGWKQPVPIKALCGGEEMPLNLAHQLLKRCDELWNMYGPTETTIWSTVKQINGDDELITIGKPIANTQIYLLDEDGELVKPGIVGEIAIAGDGVAQGYWKRPELTAERFKLNPFSNHPTGKLYRTGDLGKLLTNGEIQCLGRIDRQVKIRGHRIELGEIETVLNSLDGINQSVVVASDKLGSDTKLIAYLKAEEHFQDINAIRGQISAILPEILIPSVYMFLEDFPLTPNGKIDRKRLPIPEYQRPNSAEGIKKARSKLEKVITEVWSEHLNISDIGIDDNFFEIGGSSIIAQKVIATLIQKLDIEIPITKIFQYPTISKLSKFLGESNKNEESFILEMNEKNDSSKDIAIIGMAGKFSGAKSKEEFWDNLIQNKDTLHRFSDDELKDFEYSFAEIRDMPNYVKARGTIEDIDMWDADFFNVIPKHAKEMDPQQRVWLENTWHAFEDAGIDPFSYKGNIGVFAGSYFNTYLLNNVLRDPEKYELYIRGRTPELFQTYLNSDPMFLATRTAYFFNLRGPAINVQTACSTSLVAISQACNSLFTHESDVCVSGGVTIMVPQETGYIYSEGAITSPDGHCRPFDKDGKGTVFGNGVGTVILKRVEDAIRDNDRIYAVIKGWAINNDGNQKVGFTAPSIQGQSEVINAALSFANIKPENVGYVETHGTATPIGDPIEFASLSRVFNQSTQKKQFCGIGSVKSNIGHTDAAAGVAGMIKVALAAYHKTIPASLYYKEANPLINSKNSPFYVLNKNLKWESKAPLVMGISSFGVGGTNAHCVVQEAPEDESEISKIKYFIIPVSAKSKSALINAKKNLSNHFKNTSCKISDASYTLIKGRKHFKYRSAVICKSLSEASEKITNAPIQIESFNTPRIAFLFTGQGSQYMKMAQGLYHEFPVFKESLDAAFAIARSNHGLNLQQLLFSDESKKDINKTEYAQPAIFAVQYGMAELLKSFGIAPNVLIGHSIGEITAACVSGLFSFEDALKLVIIRGRLMQAQKPGAMLSIQLPADKVKKILPDNLDFALQNAPDFSVVSGNFDAIKDFRNKLELDFPDIMVTPLNTSHAFHSRMMDPALDEFRKEIADISFNSIEIPFVSNTTGTWVNNEVVGNIEYWVNHIRSTVKFVDGINTLLEDSNTLFVEVGPGLMLTTLLSQFKKEEHKIISVPTIRHPRNRIDDIDFFFNALSALWTYGADHLFDDWYKGERRKRISLPTYPFERKRHWIDYMPKDAETRGTGKIETDLSPVTNYNSDDNSIISSVIEIWKEYMGVPDIKPVDNFFNIGGSSLLAISISEEIEKKYSISFGLRDFYETPSVIGISECIRDKLQHQPKTETDLGPVTNYNTDDNSIINAVIEIWKEYMGVPDIKPVDNFVDIGGSSLLAISISEEIEKKYSISFSLRDFYKTPTVSGISKCISNKLQNEPI